MVENGSLEMKGIRRNSKQGIFPMCSKGEGWNDILRCEGTRFWTRGLGISMQKYEIG
jgi:hypothetical protein